MRSPAPACSWPPTTAPTSTVRPSPSTAGFPPPTRSSAANGDLPHPSRPDRVERRRPHAGAHGIGPDAVGVRQARAMADLLNELVARDCPPSWRLVSSPPGRALATAEALSQRLWVPTELDERLIEIGCGEWEGRLRDEIAHLHPEKLASRQWVFGAPRGQTLHDVRD